MNNSEVDEIIDADQTLINETAAPAIADEVLPDTLTVPKNPAAPDTVAVLKKFTAPPTDKVPPIVALFVTRKVDTDTSPDAGTFVKLEPSPKNAEAQTLS